MTRRNLIVVLGCVLLLGYLLTIGLLNENIFGIRVKSWHLVILLFLGTINVFLGVRYFSKKGVLTTTRQASFALTVWSILVGICCVDIGFTFYTNMAYPQDSNLKVGRERKSDPQIWYGELSPRLYQPTDFNFVIHKPNVRIRGNTFGEFYESSMLKSPTLRQSVLEFRHVTFSIDQHGFRDTTPIQQAQNFVLGDSFAFGYGTAQEKTWVELLEQSTGKSMYNLGVSSTGPGVQYKLFQYVLAQNKVDMKGKTLLWMIYEGNDLENRYLVEQRSSALKNANSWGKYLRGTIIEYILDIPKKIKEQSVIHHLRSNRVVFKNLRKSEGKYGGYDPFVVDGVQLKHPLFVSKKHGYRLFNPQEVERVSKPKSYVLEHPNRPRLDHTFRNMKELSQERGFKVVILLAPSAARAYGKFFEDFPAMSQRPFFLDYVADLAEKNGFQVIDLLSSLEPVIEKELLYYRDDHHWNERGNFVVADLLQAALFQ